MPTKDSGKPTSGRPAGAGNSSEAPAQASRAGKRAQPRPPTPTPQGTPRGRAAREPRAPRPSRAPAAPLEPAVRESHEEGPGDAFTPRAPSTQGHAEPLAAAEQAGIRSPAPEALSAPDATANEPARAGDGDEAEPAARGPDQQQDSGAIGTGTGELSAEEPRRRRERRGAGTNALGIFIERQFANPISPAHSYSDLERHSGISREALSRYVTARADRRRSPTIDTLVAIADALHVGLEAVARAAGASVKGVVPPPEEVQHAREEALGALVAALSDEQFSAVVELLRQMRLPVAE